MSVTNVDKRIRMLMIMMIVLLIIIVSLIYLIFFNGRKGIANTTNTIFDNQNQLQLENSINNEIFEGPKDGDYDNIPYLNRVDSNIKYVENRSDYFTVASLVDNYIEMIGEQNKTRLMAILSPNYLSQYNITDDNVFNKLTVPILENNRQYYKFRVNSMLTSQIDDATHVYIVNGSCRIVGKGTIFNIKVMIELDSVTKLYNVYPYQYIQDNSIDKIKIGEKLNYTKEEVSNRNLNKFSYITLNDKELANRYFDDFKEMILYYSEEAYTKLEPTYAKQRFNNKTEFQNYLSNNSTVLSIMQINKYSINSKEDYTEITCTDQYNNYYIFRQQGGMMRYSILLDNYTIVSKDVIEKYNNATKRDKAKYQVDTFVSKLNTKDYKAIYNKLDSTFRNNNFSTLSSLEKFIKENFYDINSIKVKEYNEKDGYSIFECEISNFNKKEETKLMTVIMNIQENMNFTMSFSFHS